METKILKIKGDWQEVVDDCRSTVSKPPLGKEPSEKFKKRVLISEHSPIRDISVRWKWVGMPSWVATHWVRHKWEHFVSTQRTDRTGIPREKLPQDQPVTFTGDANTQALIDTMRKRLCYQASPETRKYAEDFKIALRDVEPEISDVLVPNCVYRGGCPEMSACPYAKEHRMTYWDYLCYKTAYGIQETDSIQNRYDLYNDVFRSDHDGQY